jgi:hypothetical protein
MWLSKTPHKKKHTQAFCKQAAATTMVNLIHRLRHIAGEIRNSAMNFLGAYQNFIIHSRSLSAKY